MDQLELLTLAVGFAAPVLVGLVTKGSWPASLKAVLLLAISGAVGVLSAAIDAGGFGPSFDAETVAFNAAVAWVIGVATHFGLYKPAGIADAAQRALVTDRDGPSLTRGTTVDPRMP